MPVRLLLKALLLIPLIAACASMPTGRPDIERRIRQVLPADDAEPRFVAPSTLVIMRGAPTALEILLVPGAIDRNRSLGGAVAVTDRAVYYMMWDGTSTSAYLPRLAIPLSALVSVESVSSPWFAPGDYAVDIETRDPQYVRPNGSSMSSRYRISIRSAFNSGVRDQSRALCQEIADRRARIQSDGAAPMIRCDSFISRGRWDD